VAAGLSGDTAEALDEWLHVVVQLHDALAPI
jgi:hypothetical protein